MTFNTNINQKTIFLNMIKFSLAQKSIVISNLMEKQT